MRIWYFRTYYYVRTQLPYEVVQNDTFVYLIYLAKKSKAKLLFYFRPEVTENLIGEIPKFERKALVCKLSFLFGRYGKV